ncbi:MAG: zinc-binding dehydrogenase [Proteobacteria bacterium]|nr:zinc-binding dehydrogenase [Pseudomonadota bacterium]
MKAAVYYETGSPDVFRYEDVPDPTCPPNGVVIDVQVVSLEGGDTLHRAGGELVGRPHVVGYQCGGVVREVGSEARHRRVGERVVAVMPHGSHAERVAVAEAQTWGVPDGVDLEPAACVPIAVGTADDCLFEFGRLQAGETALVHAGAGGVGMAAIQLAKRAGAQVLATASSNERLDRLKEFGLDHGINYAETDFVAAVRELTGGRGADVIVDSVGGSTLEGSIVAAAYRGRITTVGSAGREAVRPNIDPLRPGNKSLIGVYFGAELALHSERVRPMVDHHIASLADQSLRIVIDRRFPLSQAAEAHRYAESRKAFGRIVLIPE